MRMNSLKPFLSTLALMFAAGLAPVQAASPDSLPVQIKRCAALTDAGARLNCYDALAGSSALNTSTAASSIAATSGGASVGTATVGVAASSPTPAQTDMEFGVHNGALEAKLVNPHREKHMLAVVSGISNRPQGELVVTLDNGQVWTQIEATRYPLKAGDHVEIDVGAMGSYVLWSPSNRRATKVTRIS
jgi:hypothetical protein